MIDRRLRLGITFRNSFPLPLFSFGGGRGEERQVFLQFRTQKSEAVTYIYQRKKILVTKYTQHNEHIRDQYEGIYKHGRKTFVSSSWKAFLSPDTKRLATESIATESK